MRLAALAIIAALLTASPIADAQSDSDTSPDVNDSGQPSDQSSPTPTSTPNVVYVVVTATPVATLAPAVGSTSYATRNGPRTEQDLRHELSAAGYQGPWDVDAMLTAYGRASAPTSTPAPTWTPTSAPVRLTLDTVLASRCYQFAVDFLGSTAAYLSPTSDFGGVLRFYENGCSTAATNDGALGEQCYEFAVRQWFQFNLNTPGGAALTLIDSLYRGCLGR